MLFCRCRRAWVFRLLNGYPTTTVGRGADVLGTPQKQVAVELQSYWDTNNPHYLRATFEPGISIDLPRRCLQSRDQGKS